MLEDLSWWRRSLVGASILLLVISACALALEHSFERAPRLSIPLDRWMFWINVAKVSAFFGYLLALFGKGKVRVILFLVGVIETLMAWPLGFFG
jgi:hypothetical protein